MPSRLPITIIGGYFGSGKTSLLHNIITEHGGGYLAMLVENPGPLNLDAKAVRGLCGAMRRLQDTVLEIPNGDGETQLAWMARALKEITQAGRFERVIIEVAGTSNPAWLAEAFQPGGVLVEWGELQQVICVVDALDFARNAQLPPAEHRMYGFVNELIADATLVVLNKCDLLDDRALDDATGILRGMNAIGPIQQTAYGEVAPDVWAKPATSHQISKLIEQRKAPRVGELPPLSTALYRVHRPFHPARFWEWFNAEHPGLLRVKGLLWLASRTLLVGGVSRTRWQNSCGAAGIWWAALPREEWPEDEASLRRMQETWREPYGDRRQELVLIGDPIWLAKSARPQLDACLLTDEEYARPVKEWGSFPDPFPEWDVES
ncbi:MAG TPA: GTP-binding protein [Candidatus Methylacidiphilales bacterium]|jgi:G3E family GTPase|nr:GTP-binding protein [Candidatus Methylacidiphilales bacterium]